MTAVVQDRLRLGPLPDQDRDEAVMIERLVLRHGLLQVVAEPADDLRVHAGPAQPFDPAEPIDGIFASLAGPPSAAAADGRGQCGGEGAARAEGVVEIPCCLGRGFRWPWRRWEM
jgi:hypothetical protein